jgi:hypothetical protein
MMRTTIPEKLLNVAAEIKEHGSANLTRLTVLKKWFEKPHRLSSFAIFVAKRASGRKGKSTGEAAKLFQNAWVLLKGANVFCPEVSQETAEKLHGRLHAFQNEHKKLRWGTARIIKNHRLFLIEEGLRIYLWHSKLPQEGYRLAANYCEHYDPSYGNCLNGESYTKIHEIVRFLFTIEALEDIQTTR